jgi:hypothetical protein
MVFEADVHADLVHSPSRGKIDRTILKPVAQLSLRRTDGGPSRKTGDNSLISQSDHPAQEHLRLSHVIEDAESNHEIESFLERIGQTISANEIAAIAYAVLTSVVLCQLDHILREINAKNPPSAVLHEYNAVPSRAASHVENREISHALESFDSKLHALI